MPRAVTENLRKVNRKQKLLRSTCIDSIFQPEALEIFRHRDDSCTIRRTSTSNLPASNRSH